MRIHSACLAALVVLALPAAARAEAREPLPDGTVVAIEVGELVVDVGAHKGIKEGDLLELWRPLRVRHPVTGQVLVDRFRIGSLRLVQVRSALSLATVEGALSRPPAIGDVIVLPAEAREAQGPPKVAAEPSARSRAAAVPPPALPALAVPPAAPPAPGAPPATSARTTLAGDAEPRRSAT
jgi:hypothetical protein